MPDKQPPGRPPIKPEDRKRGINVTFHVNYGLLQRLNAECDRLGVTRAEYIRSAFEDKLKQENDR